jgi:hypothetical protein
VYCLSNGDPFIAQSIEIEELQSIVSSNFSIIVKYVSDCEFSEENFKRNLSDIQWLETHAREHIGVINRIMEHTTVIPFKFGTIFQTEANLKKFIADYNDSITENFQHIAGKEEWAVKMYCDRKKLSDKIDEFSEEADALEKQIMASSPGKAFLLKRKKAELIENEMDRLCKYFGQKNYDELKNLSDSVNLNNLLPKEFTGRVDTMILNATFLVKRNNLADFKTTVSRLTMENEKSGFFIDVTGPWPPFSFISIKEKQ